MHGVIPPLPIYVSMARCLIKHHAMETYGVSGQLYAPAALSKIPLVRALNRIAVAQPGA